MGLQVVWFPYSWMMVYAAVSVLAALPWHLLTPARDATST